jgi:hypothetical protein
LIVNKIRIAGLSYSNSHFRIIIGLRRGDLPVAQLINFFSGVQQDAPTEKNNVTLGISKIKITGLSYPGIDMFYILW